MLRGNPEATRGVSSISSSSLNGTQKLALRGSSWVRGWCSPRGRHSSPPHRSCHGHSRAPAPAPFSGRKSSVYIPLPPSPSPLPLHQVARGAGEMSPQILQGVPASHRVGVATPLTSAEQCLHGPRSESGTVLIPSSPLSAWCLATL